MPSTTLTAKRPQRGRSGRPFEETGRHPGGWPPKTGQGRQPVSSLGLLAGRALTLGLTCAVMHSLLEGSRPPSPRLIAGGLRGPRLVSEARNGQLFLGMDEGPGPGPGETRDGAAATTLKAMKRHKSSPPGAMALDG